MRGREAVSHAVPSAAAYWQFLHGFGCKMDCRCRLWPVYMPSQQNGHRTMPQHILLPSQADDAAVAAARRLDSPGPSTPSAALAAPPHARYAVRTGSRGQVKVVVR